MEHEDTAICKLCGQDAVYHTLTQSYKNEDFCDRCYHDSVAVRPNSYIMVVDLRKHAILNHKPRHQTEVEKIDIGEQSPEVQRLYREVKRHLQ